MDEFRIFRKNGTGASEHKKELINLDHSVKDEGIAWGAARNRLAIEKGVPTRQGLHTVKLVWIHTHENGMWCTTKDGGTLEVEEKKTVAELKALIAKRAAGTNGAPGEREEERLAGGAEGEQSADAEHECMQGVSAHLRIIEDKSLGAAEPRKILVDDLPLAGESERVAGRVYLCVAIRARRVGV